MTNAPIPAAGEALPKFEPTASESITYLKPMNFSAFSMADYLNIYNAIMTIEEAACQAASQAMKKGVYESPSSEYLFALQEFLSAERGDLVEKLRTDKFRKPSEEEQRICLLLQHEAWCGEFHNETLALLASSTLPTKAV